MSGLLATNFRKGNLSEILADYLLSSIGIATPIRRQDDIGFDFYCQLSDQETGPIQTFSNPFILQIKSDSVSSIKYGADEHQKWRPEQISWLFNLEWPLFIGSVDKKDLTLKIYQTTTIRFVLYQYPHCTQIEFVIPEEEVLDDIKNPEIVKLDGWPEGKGDGHLYKVPLGNPIISFTANDLDENELLNERKNILRNYREIEMKNIIYRKQGIKHFQWVPKIITNTPIQGWAFMYYGIFNQDISQDIKDSIIPGLISLLFQLQHHQPGSEELKELKAFMRRLPNLDIFKQFKVQHPSAFDWVD